MRKFLGPLLLLVAVAAPPAALAWSKAWADTNDYFYDAGTGSKTEHVATMDRESGDDPMYGDCRKADGQEVQWTEFQFITASHIPVERVTVHINTLTGGPSPRSATCRLYDDNGLMIEDWYISVD